MTPMAKNRVILVGIALMFVLPVLIAWLIYDDPSVVGMSQTKNYGQLLQPAVPIELADYVSQKDAPALDELRGRWTILHLDINGKCGEACDASIKAMQQVHILLNKDAQRLQRRVLFAGKPDQALRQTWADRDVGLQVIEWNTAQLKALESALTFPLEDGMILMMDPLGNVMMHYAEDFDPYGVQSDLRLLFKASQIG